MIKYAYSIQLKIAKLLFIKQLAYFMIICIMRITCNIGRITFFISKNKSKLTFLYANIQKRLFVEKKPLVNRGKEGNKHRRIEGTLKLISDKGIKF